MKAALKRFIESRLPSLARNCRRLRDYLHSRKVRPYGTLFGFRLYGDAHMGTSCAASREAEVFAEFLGPADAVIDIGANVGLFSCLAAKAGKHVIAVEPHPQNLQFLYRNLRLNGFSKVEVIPVALSDAPGLLPLYGGGQGATLLHGWGGIEANYETLVAVNTVDNLFFERFRGQRLLIKMDVEGNEYRVLMGARAVLGDDPGPVWVVEHGLSENFSGAGNPHFQELFEAFWALGYRAYTTDSHRRQVTEADVKRWVANGKKDFGSINYLFLRARQSNNRSRDI